MRAATLHATVCGADGAVPKAVGTMWRPQQCTRENRCTSQNTLAPQLAWWKDSAASRVLKAVPLVTPSVSPIMTAGHGETTDRVGAGRGEGSWRCYMQLPTAAGQQAAIPRLAQHPARHVVFGNQCTPTLHPPLWKMMPASASQMPRVRDARSGSSVWPSRELQPSPCTAQAPAGGHAH